MEGNLKKEGDLCLVAEVTCAFLDTRTHTHTYTHTHTHASTAPTRISDVPLSHSFFISPGDAQSEALKSVCLLGRSFPTLSSDTEPLQQGRQPRTVSQILCKSHEADVLHCSWSNHTSSLACSITDSHSQTLDPKSKGHTRAASTPQEESCQ